MEPRLKTRFNDTILHEAMQRYDIAAHAIRLLDGFESFIYEFQRHDNDYILRIGHSLRRNAALIHGEVDWINYLAEGGATVAKAVSSRQGELVEAIEDGHGEFFLATAFVKAQGQPAWEHGWSPELFERYGRLVGRMHALSTRYQVPHVAWKRPEWDDEIMLDGDKHTPESDERVRERFRELLAYLRTLPKNPEWYGLIHFDAHAGNFFVDEAGAITLFDFDDCHYNWFINDIAIVLFYMVVNREDATAFTQTFMPRFLHGYCQEFHFDPAWLKEIPHFLKFREIDLYAIIHRSFDVENLDDPWCARYMHGRKARIEENVPYLDFDFETLHVPKRFAKPDSETNSMYQLHTKSFNLLSSEMSSM